MIQGGGQTAGGESKTTHAPILNEAETSGLSNSRGTLAMARTDQPHSATSGFFINLVDNDFLDPEAGNDGYAVFGEVVSGMDVVDAIAALATDGQDAPLEVVVIEETERIQ
jgi:cyclophilin family peptidyl-prolyl cis-trans isomerase